MALTAAAEAQAGAGHDILRISDWQPGAYADLLEPVDELVNSLIEEYGKVLLGTEYVGKQKGHWAAMPTGNGTTALVPCARIDMLKEYAGLDVEKMYPAGVRPTGARRRLDLGCFPWRRGEIRQGGLPVGLPLSNQSDAVNWVGAVFASHGADSSTRRGRSRSSPTRPGMCSNGSSGWCRCCRRASLRGITPATTNGWFRARAR